MGELSPPAGREALRVRIEQLLASAPGSVIFDQLVHLAAEWRELEAQLDHTYGSLLRLLLEDFARNPSSEHVLELAGRLIQTRQSVGHAPRAAMQADDLAVRLANDDSFRIALDNLLARLPAPLSTEPAAPSAPAVTTESAVPPEPVTEPVAAEVQPDSAACPEVTPEAELRMTSAYRQHLERRRGEIDKLQDMLALKVREAIAQNKEFGDLLQIERSALQHAESLEEISTLRQILVGGIEELLKGQGALAENLTGTSEYLRVIESDSEQLREELQKVRLLSLTDDFTGLPNRRAFMRRLEDEIGRAQRHGSPLALAILDLDEFKVINDTLGHAAGDEILRCYASQVLSMFRQYDMVSRYGGEEFAVLLPTTTLEGATCALRKVQMHAAALRCDYDGRSLALPTFSCGLTLYLPGESLTSFLERADRALYRAKHLGRNRIEVDIADKLAGATNSVQGG
jgi:diguanylate cyclase (GGDEF)-like protein